MSSLKVIATPLREKELYMEGWIKLHRKIIEWEWFTDRNVLQLWICLLSLANHKETKWRGENIKAGQILTGRKQLAELTKLSEQQIRTAISKLKSTSNLTIKSSNKYSVITILNWIDYQQVTSNLTNEQPTNNQQITTSKNDKKVKNNINTSINKDKPYGNEFINLILKRFDSIYGFPPIDKYPRKVAWNLYQIINSSLNGDYKNKEGIEKVINVFFDWVEEEKSLEKVKNLDIIKRNFGIFKSQVKA